MFKLNSKFKPTGDQPKAIKHLVEGINKNVQKQILLGATGTGKTFTIANVIQEVKKPTLVMVHNRTLAGQLYEELKALFPDSRVEYFVSNFDFYQPEAYIPSSDSYIDKSSKHNSEIEMMRMSAVNALTWQKENTIVVATVAAIYGTWNPIEYKKMHFELEVGVEITRKDIVKKLVSRQYKRNDTSLEPGTFRVKGDVIEIVPGWTNTFHYLIDMFGDEIEMIAIVDTLTGVIQARHKRMTISPAEDYSIGKKDILDAVERIEKELEEREKFFLDNDMLVEHQRIKQRTRSDIESLKEFGICSGIENYSMHLEKRNFGDPTFCLLDYFGDDWLLVADESHLTIPQIGGMYKGDRSRKQTLVDYGFRLPSALENRPLRYDEFMDRISHMVYLSATPGDTELELVPSENIVEQVVRPTGIVDAQIEVLPKEDQIERMIVEINKVIERKEKTFITTLTKKMAEDLTDYLAERGLKVAYIHSELKTLERMEVLRQLRIGRYDVVVGINLIREGLDIPEVSLVCILDADKQGFLRNTRSLVQTIGRACRNTNGRVIMFANTVSRSMQEAIDETDRRRAIQVEYNKKHNITPITITKDIRGPIRADGTFDNLEDVFKNRKRMTDEQKIDMIKDLRKQMLDAAKMEDFETAALLRDAIIELEK